MQILKVEDSYFPRNRSLNLGGKLSTMGQPQVMAIINCTPDSFYKESRFSLTDNYLATAEEMISAGATFLDIGGYSSRPGAVTISVEEELNRVIPVITNLSKRFPTICISIDTFRSEVARAAIDHGAQIVNDITGGNGDSLMFETVAALKCPYILMHMKGTPQTMQSETQYTNLFGEICQYFSLKISQLKALGVNDILLDPGFGFAKTIDQNFELLNRLQDFHFLGHPLLVGFSRKSTIYKTLGITPEESLNGTTVLNTIALRKGAAILRVHDVKQAIEAVKLVNCLQ